MIRADYILSIKRVCKNVKWTNKYNRTKIHIKQCLKFFMRSTSRDIQINNKKKWNNQLNAQ